MVFFIAFRAMQIERRALLLDQRFQVFSPFDWDLVYLPDVSQRWCGSRYVANKRLTLPLISYGGSSLIIMSTAIVMLLRIDYESRHNRLRRL